MPRTVPTLASESPGNFLTGALWNANIKALGDFLVGSGANGAPMFYGYQATGQSMPNSAWAAINIDTEVIDTDGGHSTSTNTSRYTCQVAGYYWVTGNAVYAANGTDYRGAAIFKNGVQLVGGANVQQANAGATRATCVVSTPLIVPLAVGDYIELFGNQISGGPLSTQADTTGGKNCSLLAAWIHA